ncbi:XRE family transcriptional regulator [Actinoplanes sp. NPDC049118]|uniref:XRE family transcriptional regulator n=1 Tax=Actinoplanes sp. NPDC049118 TaxID=3155769 RepID=UPI003404870A
MAPAGEPPPPRTLADKLRHLVDTVHPPGRGPFSFREIADEIRKQRPGERTISHTQIADLCSGRSANPQQATLTLLAGFFKVPVAYFFDEAVEQQHNEQLDVVAGLRDTQAQQLALRLNGLSPKSIDLVAEMIRRVRELEGLEEEPS